MGRIASLAPLIVLSALITGSLPTIQSSNSGLITINSPIILRTPFAGPLEANRPPVSSVATAQRRHLVSRILRRLTAAASQNPVVGMRRNDWDSLPPPPGLHLASAPLPLPSSGPLVSDPTELPLSAAVAEGADAQNMIARDAPTAVTVTPDTGPVQPPRGSGAKESDREKKAGGSASK